jgi:putative ABC transport system permease protein
MDFLAVLKISIRNLLKQPFYSFLNIIGFGCGITVFAFVSIYVVDQHMYDRWVGDKDVIYRLEAGDWAITGTLQGPYVKERVAGIEDVLRVDVNWFSNADVMYDDQLYSVPKMIMADSTFFDFFPMEFIAGTPDNALSDNFSIVLTRSQAEVVFGHTDVIGETLHLLGRTSVVVTGVIENVRYSHIPINAIIPFALMADMRGDPEVLNTFGAWNYFTFLKLHPGADVQEVERAINEVLSAYLSDLAAREMEMNYFLRPLSDIYFADQIAWESPIKHGSRRSVNAFSLIAFFVLFIAVINFINMSTARAFTRSKEVGVRKLLGSTRQKLIWQFLTESVITTALSVLLALLLVEWVLPHFNSLAGTTFRMSDVSWPYIVLVLAGGTLLVGLLSGIYPAAYLTAFQPVAVLKGQKTRGRKGLLFRKVLIVFQFAVSIALIASTILVSQQIKHMKEQQLGFDKEDLIYFDINFRDRKEALRQRILEHPNVMEVSFSNSVPGNVNWQESSMVNGVRKQYTFWPVHADFLSLLDVNPLAGRHFDPDMRSEHRNTIMINETAINFLELQGSYEEIVGQDFEGRRIVGILPDFHYNSLHHNIAPLVVFWDEDRSYMVTVKTNGHNMPEVVEHLEKARHEFMPNRHFRSFYLDMAFDQLYQDEEQFGNIMMLFAAFAIFIASLGLFGLASFLAAQRTREVSIRKVVGASTMRIYVLLLKDYLLLVGIGFLLAVPPTWFFMEKWLSSFAYQIEGGLAPFLLAGMFAIVLTALTVSFHTMRVSMANPADALKYE